MRRAWQTLIPLAILALSVGLRIIDPVAMQQARLLTLDAYQRLEPRPYTPDLPVRIIDIDDESLARLGQWPWPRTIIADLEHDAPGRCSHCQPRAPPKPNGGQAGAKFAGRRDSGCRDV